MKVRSTFYEVDENVDCCTEGTVQEKWPRRFSGKDMAYVEGNQENGAPEVGLQKELASSFSEGAGE